MNQLNELYDNLHQTEAMIENLNWIIKNSDDSNKVSNARDELKCQLEDLEYIETSIQQMEEDL